MRINKLLKAIIFVLICEGVGLISGFFTIGAIPNWYMTLNKPSFSPPNWLFGPVWTILYFMMGIAAYLVSLKGLKNKQVKIALLFFLIQLGLNFLWSIFFFGQRSPLLGFMDIILLWVTIAITIFKFFKISKIATYLLLPYWFWVSFASILNLTIIILNP